MKFVKFAAAALALSAAPALAQTGAANEQVAAGATVSGPEGNQVGTIVSVESGQTVLDTGKHKVPLAVDMYGKGETGPTITVSKAQLDAMIDAQLAEAAAARDAALVAGAAVTAADGQPLGTVSEVEGDRVVVARGGDDTDLVTLQREYFDAGETGLTARLTTAQIEEALAAVTGAAE